MGDNTYLTEAYKKVFDAEFEQKDLFGLIINLPIAGKEAYIDSAEREVLMACRVYTFEEYDVVCETLKVIFPEAKLETKTDFHNRNFFIEVVKYS